MSEGLLGVVSRFLVNLRSKLRGYGIRVKWDNQKNLYELSRGSEVIFISRLGRYWRYKRGINDYAHGLAKQYLFDEVKAEANDVVIDCGANIGELGIWANSVNARYVAFEPEELEASCCDINAFNGESKTNRAALWHENTELQFYSKPDSADSSLIEIEKFDDVRMVRALKLSDYLSEHNIDKIRILKVEAEGAEPEVLMGAESILKSVDYISVDCGFERGIEQKSTFNEVNNILRRNNFFVTKANLDRHIYLFKRSDLE